MAKNQATFGINVTDTESFHSIEPSRHFSPNRVARAGGGVRRHRRLPLSDARSARGGAGVRALRSPYFWSEPSTPCSRAAFAAASRSAASV
jgi:hypothetical protein